jgi:hypothetical protein
MIFAAKATPGSARLTSEWEALKIRGRCTFLQL